jgi:hypothetical protein
MVERENFYWQKERMTNFLRSNNYQNNKNPQKGREKEGLISCGAIITQVSRQNSLEFINRIRAFHESRQLWWFLWVIYSMCPGDLYFPVGEGNSLDIDIIEPENNLKQSLNWKHTLGSLSLPGVIETIE